MTSSTGLKEMTRMISIGRVQLTMFGEREKKIIQRLIGSRRPFGPTMTSSILTNVSKFWTILFNLVTSHPMRTVTTHLSDRDKSTFYLQHLETKDWNTTATTDSHLPLLNVVIQWRRVLRPRLVFLRNFRLLFVLMVEVWKLGLWSHLQTGFFLLFL